MHFILNFLLLKGAMQNAFAAVPRIDLSFAVEFMHIKKCRVLSDVFVFVFVWVPSRSVHPYANPEVLSFPVEDGSLAYMQWMDEAIPDN